MFMQVHQARRAPAPGWPARRGFRGGDPWSSISCFANKPRLAGFRQLTQTRKALCGRNSALRASLSVRGPKAALASTQWKVTPGRGRTRPGGASTRTMTRASPSRARRRASRSGEGSFIGDEQVVSPFHAGLLLSARFSKKCAGYVRHFLGGPQLLSIFLASSSIMSTIGFDIGLGHRLHAAALSGHRRDYAMAREKLGVVTVAVSDWPSSMAANRGVDGFGLFREERARPASVICAILRPSSPGGDSDEALVLEPAEGRIDDAGRGAVSAVAAVLDRLDQFVAVRRLVTEQLEQDETQATMAEAAAATFTSAPRPCGPPNSRPMRSNDCRRRRGYGRRGRDGGGPRPKPSRWPKRGRRSHAGRAGRKILSWDCLSNASVTRYIGF